MIDLPAKLINTAVIAPYQVDGEAEYAAVRHLRDNMFLTLAADLPDDREFVIRTSTSRRTYRLDPMKDDPMEDVMKAGLTEITVQCVVREP